MSLKGSRRVFMAMPGDALRIVVEDFAFLVQTALDVRIVELLDPHLRALDEVVVDIALLEHLELEIAVADDDLLDLVEVARCRRCGGDSPPSSRSAAGSGSTASLVDVLLRDVYGPVPGSIL